MKKLSPSSNDRVLKVPLDKRQIEVEHDLKGRHDIGEASLIQTLIQR